jgi:hypothetical protein
MAPMQLKLEQIDGSFCHLWLSPVLCDDVKQRSDGPLPGVWEEFANS